MAEPAEPDLFAAAVEVWERAIQAANALAVCRSSLGGVRLRSWSGPVRDAWLAYFKGLLPATTPTIVIHPQVDDTQLQGGLDLAATLREGRPQHSFGLLAAANEGVLQVRMAERLRDMQIAAVNAALDEGQHRVERDGVSKAVAARLSVVALDESDPDEPLMALPLAERLGLDVDLHRCPNGVTLLTHELSVAATPEEIAAAKARLPDVEIPDALLPALCGTALRAGIDSLRVPQFALAVARAMAALDGETTVSAAHAEVAVQLVYAPRARMVMAPEEPPSEGEAPEEEPPEENQGNDAPPDDGSGEDSDDPPPMDLDELTELLLAALPATLPDQLLSRAAALFRQRSEGAVGRAGPRRLSFNRGSPLPAVPGLPEGRKRLDLLATLRRAAPWQRLRRGKESLRRSKERPRRSKESPRSPQPALLIERDDIAIKRFVQHAAVVTIFIVDASGSSAMQRLAEVKGAVELLLGECYVRRDQVALIAFRGTSAELLLPPTRSLVRAKRSLSGLPGGGGTPLPAGLSLGLDLAQRVNRSGSVPLLVLLTDGRPNVCLAGHGDRQAAATEAEQLARAIANAALPMLVIDTSLRGQRFLAELAGVAGAAYERLPNASEGRLSAEIASVGAGLRRAS